MSKDFANRKSGSDARTGKSSSRGGTQRKRKPTPKKKRTPPRVFHGPSFSGGIVLGALLVIAAAYVPDVFREEVQKTLAVKSREAREAVQFEFDERLRESEVRADPDAYAEDAGPASSAEMEYLIQAASFQARNDAESLRAQLILINLPVRTNAVQVGDKPWYRVTVGPFLSQVEAGRAMTRLRELNLDAFLIKRER